MAQQPTSSNLELVAYKTEENRRKVERLEERVGGLEKDLDELKDRSEAVLLHFENRREDARTLFNEAKKTILILLGGAAFTYWVIPLLQHVGGSGHP